MTPCNSSRGVIFHSMMIIRHITTSIFCLGALAACRSGSVPAPTSGPTPDVTPPTPPTETHTSSSWSIPISHSTHSYHSISRTIIQEAESQSSRRDTVEVSAWFTITNNQQQSSPTFAGSIDSIYSKPNAIPSFRRIDFSALLNGTEMILTAETPGASTDYCTIPGFQFLSEIRPLLMLRPVRLDHSTTWVDSSSTTTCSSGIPLTKQIARSYRVGDQQLKAGAQLLELLQTEAIHFSGTGAQTQHQLTISGEGQGTIKLYIDINSGIPITSEAREITTVSISSSGQIRRFIQQTQQNINLIR